MSMLQRAQAVLQGLSADPQPLNCYWYGYAVVADGGSASVHPPQNNPAGCPPPQLQPPYSVGWIDPDGSPLVGTTAGNTIAFTDCSGFMAYLLRGENESGYRAIGRQLADITDPVLRNYLAVINKQHGQPWPSAADYAVLGMHDAGATPPFLALGGNAGLDLTSLQPGDILAWALAPELHDTGHVVLVNQAPVQNADGTWSVNVIDSSLFAHQNDLRPGRTGVGSGTIAMQRAPDGGWNINFDVTAGDAWHEPLYVSGLRLGG
jgi:hypothetical protein